MTDRTKRGAQEPVAERAIARLKDELKRRGVTQLALAKRTGMAQGHLSKTLNGKALLVSFDVIARICLAADISMDWLVRDAPGLGAPGAPERDDTPIPTSSVVPSSKK